MNERIESRTTTPAGNGAMRVSGGYARPCWKCSGSGIYWKQGPTATGWGAYPAGCYPCKGSGATGKVYADIVEYDKALARAEKARERSEAKRVAEREAGRAEREAGLARELAEAEARHAELAEWSHLSGSEGDKVEVSGEVAVATNVETQFGVSRLVVIETAEKQAVKLFTTAEWSFGISRGDAVTVSGTIKGFSEYGGKPQTTLNRPKQLT